VGVRTISGIRRPWESINYPALIRDFPPPPEYLETSWLDPPDTIERKQLVRLQARLMSASKVPFVSNLWETSGFNPRSVTSIEDLRRAPTYSVDHVRECIEANPPLGDYQGVLPSQARSEPMRLHMSGGTTGSPRPTLFTNWDREVGGILMARSLYLGGIRPGDLVINAWSYSTHYAAWAYDRALYEWLNCVVITAGTGLVTSSEKQIELALQYGATSILATGDYLLRLAEVAKEMGYDPRDDLQLRALPSIDHREQLESTFGAEVLGHYGLHEVAGVSAECPARDGLHIYEDAFVVEIVDPDTGDLLPEGELGAVCVTELYKTGSPQIRYNTMDLSYLYPREQCDCGSWLRRMAPFQGRADNMVKLRGVNVWPEAVGDLAMSVDGVERDWFVRALRRGGQDELVVSFVTTRGPSEYAALEQAVEKKIRSRLGVSVGAEAVEPGNLDAWTGLNETSKSRRFRDDR